MASSEQDLLARLRRLGWWQQEVAAFANENETYVAAITAGRITDSDELAGKSLGDLLPGLELKTDSSPTDYVTSVRAHSSVSARSKDEWADIATHSAVQILSWPQVGRKTCREIIRAVLRGWADQDHDPAESSSSPAPLDPPRVANQPENEHLESLEALAMELYSHGATTLADAVGLLSAPGADFVSFESLREAELADLLGLGDEAAAWSRFLDLDEAAKAVTRARIFPVGSRRTLDDVGVELGITRERVRQIEKRTKAQLESKLAANRDFAVIRHAAARLRQELGSVTTNELLASALRQRIGGDGPNAELNRAALRELAGPYNHFEDLWELEGTLDGIKSTLLSDPTRPLSHGDLEALLTSRGVHLNARDSVLSVMPLFAFEDFHLVWTGSLQDKAYLILSTHGEPMTRNELHIAMGGDTVNPRSLSNAIASDERFRRLGRDQFGLVSWGGEEYTGIEDQIERIITRHGGRAQVDDVVTELVESFGVSPNSVRSYAGSSRFTRDRDGGISLASGSEGKRRISSKPAEFDRALALVEGAWVLKVEVDQDVLRGSGRPLRIANAQAAGVTPGQSRTIALENGEVKIYWRGNQPALGSLKSLAHTLDCEEGDFLFLPLSDGASAYSMASDLRQHSVGLSRVGLELGLRDPTPDLTTIGVALGLAPGARAVDIYTRLKARGQLEVAEYLPREHPATNDDLEQLKGLGE